MTLEECIEYFEIEAEMSDSLMIPYESRKKYSDDCKQMAEWLRELEELRREHTCNECRYSSYGFSDHPCSVCRRGYYPRHSMTDYYEMEANADE